MNTESTLETTEAEAGIGHNSGDAADIKTGGIAADRLKSMVDRIERLQEDRKAINEDVKDIYSEAKSAGFDTKVLRALITLRTKEPDTVEEFETLLDVYRRALGM